VIIIAVFEHIKSKITYPLPHIGMRNVKSALAIIVCFFAWQMIRWILPILEMHPLYGYVAVVLVMKDTIDKSLSYGMIRLKGTVIGLIVALVCITASVEMQLYFHSTYGKTMVELGMIVIGVCVSLYVAYIFKCDNFCAIASVVFLVCIIRYNKGNLYVHAILRASETIMGMGISLFVNKYVFPYKTQCHLEKGTILEHSKPSATMNTCGN
jgi:uncharacterized membrane protein YgaE (UPF0421/DUF939 family)